jgi:hypothetical protein
VCVGVVPEQRLQNSYLLTITSSASILSLAFLATKDVK